MHPQHDSELTSAGSRTSVSSVAHVRQSVDEGFAQLRGRTEKQTSTTHAATSAHHIANALQMRDNAVAMVRRTGLLLRRHTAAAHALPDYEPAGDVHRQTFQVLQSKHKRSVSRKHIVTGTRTPSSARLLALALRVKTRHGRSHFEARAPILHLARLQNAVRQRDIIILILHRLWIDTRAR